jgi:hypothetical protein
MRRALARGCLSHLKEDLKREDNDVEPVLQLLYDVTFKTRLCMNVRAKAKKPAKIKSFRGAEIAGPIEAIIQEAKGDETYLQALTTMAMVHAWKTCGGDVSRMAKALHAVFPDVYGKAQAQQ